MLQLQRQECIPPAIGGANWLCCDRSQTPPKETEAFSSGNSQPLGMIDRSAQADAQFLVFAKSAILLGATRVLGSHGCALAIADSGDH